jgi:YD repeat-containing protein
MQIGRAIGSVRLRGTAASVSARVVRRVLTLVGIALTSAALAATTTYQYDALGRLVQVNHNNGNVTTYTLDAAGNRTQLTDTSPLAAPTTLNVPPTSSTGSYSISWSGGGTVTTYELYESTNSSYVPQTRVYQGPVANTNLTGHGNGSYYYRVRGCVGSACTQYKTGGPTVVTLSSLPGQPTGLSYSAGPGCSWNANWSNVSGATSYTIRDWSGNFQYSVPQTANPTISTNYSYCGVPGYTGNPSDYRPKWVKACNSNGCGAQGNFP